jgi:hypothetical protein
VQEKYAEGPSSIHDLESSHFEYLLSFARTASGVEAGAVRDEKSAPPGPEWVIRCRFGDAPWTLADGRESVGV